MTRDDVAIGEPSASSPTQRRVAGLALAQFQAAARAHLIAMRSAELPRRAARPPDFERERAGASDGGGLPWPGRAAEWQRAGLDDAQVWPSLRPWFAKMLAITEAELAASAPDERWLWQIDVAISHENLGDAAVLADELVVASDWFAQLCATLRALSAARPQHDGLGDRLLRAYDKATHVAICLGRFEEAHGWLEHALEAVEAAPRAVRWQRAAGLRVYATLGDVAVARERPRDAAAWFDCALEASRWLCEREAWSGWHHALCVALVARAEVARDAAEASPLLYEAQKLVGDLHGTTAQDRAVLAERIAALCHVHGERG